MATQVSLTDGAVASAGALAIQTNGTTQAVSISTGQVATLAQNPILTSGTANGVAYLNGSKAVTSGSALVFDGTNLGLGVTPSAWGGSFKALQIGLGTSLYNNASGNGTFLGSNFYWDGTNNKYLNTNTATAYGQSAGAHQWYTAASGTAGNAITFTQAMTLDASGNLGVGNTSPGSFARLTVQDSGSGAGTLALISSAASNAIYIKNTGTSADFKYNDAYPMTWSINGTERMRLDSSGNLLVGTTDAGQNTGVGVKIKPGANSNINVVASDSTNATSNLNLYSTGASAYRFYVGMGGTINATSTTITGISDVRLKENIRDLDDGLDVVMALKPRKFDWKEGKGADIKNARGFIAQEFEQVLPDMIEEWKDPAPEGEEPYKAVNANLIPTLVKAIQEQQALITQLQADVAALKGA